MYSAKRNIVAFGVGNNLDWLLKHKKDLSIELTYVIDNDKKKQGCLVGDICSYASGNEAKIVIAEATEVLSSVNANDTVVFICNDRYKNEMRAEAESYGVSSIVIVSDMPDYEIEIPNEKTAYLDDVTIKNGIEDKIAVIVDKHGGHGIYITYAIHDINPDMGIVWVVSDLKMDAPDYVRKVSVYNWKRAIYEIATAKVVIYDSATLGVEYKKRVGQFFFQTKHWSSVTLKKFWMGEAYAFSEKTINSIKRLSNDTDYCVVGSAFDEESLKEGFDYAGKFLNVGSCRSDILFVSNKDSIYQELGLSKEYNYILYSPTFRKIHDKGGVLNKASLGVAMPDFEKIINVFENKYGGEWHVIIRLHPSIVHESKNISVSEKIHNLTTFQDGQKVVAISDAMITDYSSIMFEMLFVQKPVYLYAPDLDDFLKNQRDFLVDYGELPFSVSKNQDELLEKIYINDENTYKEEYIKFMKKYGVHEDGHASERTALFINSLI